jgi:putative nucleotidyltransferase with HDIG domain
MGNPPNDHRWQARPVLSWLLRAVVLLVPLAAGVGSAAVLSRVVPRPSGAAGLLWWVLLFGVSGTVTWLLDRLARRLLPLAVLLRLTLLFPDRAPSRFAVARQVGTTKSLEQRVRRAREVGASDDPTRAAVQILELVAALNAHDSKTRGHSERVRVLTDLLAEEMRIPVEDRDRLRWSALLHDIGKLEVSAEILNKPGKPDADEWQALKRHPAAGARLAGPLLAWLGDWGRAIEEHHERFDGDGYPTGLAGKGISLGGRMLAVTDAFETMTASRSYRKPMSVPAARRELARCSDQQFDRDIVRSFLNVSLGRLWWQVGPVSWVAQLPFISLRTAGGAASAAARAGLAAATSATVGLVALGGSGIMALPARGAPPAQVAQPSPGAMPGLGTGESPRPHEVGEAEDGPGGEKDGGGGPQGGTSDQEADPGGGSGGEGGGSGSEGGGSGGGSGGGGGSDDPREPGGGGDGGIVRDTLEDPVGTVEDALEDPVGTVEDAVDDVTDTVGDVVDEVGDTVEDVLKGGKGGGLPLP